ncbi:MAG: hypothetical protein U5K54_20515 [Cytophagales bacterium]|nr:hypothetical protein [Cytophagales bacterium]
MPGFIDCHTHFMDGGFALSSVQLRDARTPQRIYHRIKGVCTYPTQKGLDNEWETGIMKTGAVNFLRENGLIR